MKKSIRLDSFLFERDHDHDLEGIRKKIIAGWVTIDGETVRTPSRKISGRESIIVKKPGGAFASRGGDKLNHALEHFNLSVEGLRTADLGSSTGGFTDCLLKNGALKVYAIDVGYGILDYNLRNDNRVVVKERTNVRKLKKDDFREKIDFITVDLSFISITKVFGKILEIFTPVKGIILLKPQFEAKRSEQNRGVVNDKGNHIRILKRVIKSLIEKGMVLNDLHYSPLKGPAGNIEFLLHFQTGHFEAVHPEGGREKDGEPENIDRLIEEVIDEAYNYEF